MKEEVEALKKLIRTTYKAFYWISIFFLIPTIGKYFFLENIIQYGIDTGILILFFSLWRIKRRMEKREKEDKKLKKDENRGKQ